MDIKKIKEIAEKTGLSLCMYGRPRLVDNMNGTLTYKASGELTPYGENLVAFANEIERKVKMQCVKEEILSHKGIGN